MEAAVVAYLTVVVVMCAAIGACVWAHAVGECATAETLYKVIIGSCAASMTGLYAFQRIYAHNCSKRARTR